jgi:hypothetical protein
MLFGFAFSAIRKPNEAGKHIFFNDGEMLKIE